jgi:hypothetical protein
MTITEENVYNQWTIISKYHYALKTLTKNAVGVKYRYDSGWSDTNNRAFTFWFRPQYLKPIGASFTINSITNNAGNAMITAAALPLGLVSIIEAGDWIVVRGTTSYNSIQPVKSVDTVTKTITLDIPYIDSIISNNTTFKKEVSNTIIQYDNYEVATPVISYVQLTYTTNWFIIKLNNDYYKYDLSESAVLLSQGKWYAATINLNNLAQQLSLFLYNTVELNNAINPDRTTNLINIYTNTQTIPATSVPDGFAWKLIGGETDLTNIRIWSEPIEEELQELILSQYVVRDSHLALLLDNASPSLMLPTVTNPR